MSFFPATRRWWVAALVVLCLAAATWGCRDYICDPTRGLPHRYSFLSGKLDDWKAFGGTWEVSNGSMQNASDERGAKLITGSQYWTNYSVEADVQLSGSEGDAGLVVRVGDEDEGVDSYRGYYAGLSSQPYKLASTDNLILIGKADHAYGEITHAGMPGGVVPFQWYHLKVLVYGCQVVASATFPIDSSQTTTVSTTDPNCIPAGKIGLRSYATGALWRDVMIRTASHADLVAMLGTSDSTPAGAPSTIAALEPLSVDDMKSGAPARAAQVLAVNPGHEGHIENVESIRDLGLSSPADISPATVRGIVVATAPGLYIQDSNAGVQILQKANRSFNIGDEVQATGQVQVNGAGLVLRDAAVDLLWAGAPIAPLSVTASQAAVGSVDPTLIEVKGYLRRKERGADGTLILSLEEGQQNFLAIMNGERASLLFKRLKIGSLLTLRGICAADARYTHNLVPFALLLRSTDDVDVIAGPPWWSTGHLIAITLAALLLLLMGQYVYGRIEHWRLRAVLEERERLAHEMHDTLAQSFAGIGFQLQAVLSELPSSNSNVRQHVELACDLVRHSHEEARRCIATLRPASLYQVGLLAALERCAARMVEGGSVHIHTSSEGTPQIMPVLVSDTLFRIGQEAIANAVRHAKATSIRISLAYQKHGVQLSIEDDGVGFASEGVLLGFGLRGMRERAHIVSASLRIESGTGRGTRVLVIAPLPPQLSLSTFPRYVWKYFREHSKNGQENAAPNPHFDRG